MFGYCLNKIKHIEAQKQDIFKLIGLKIKKNCCENSYLFNKRFNCFAFESSKKVNVV